MEAVEIVLFTLEHKVMEDLVLPTNVHTLSM